MIRKFPFYLFLTLLAVACGKNGDSASVNLSEQTIVAVNGQSLLRGELDNVISASLSAEDSAAVAKTYIDKWIKDQLLYEKAKQNIGDKKEIDQMVESYKKSLIMINYQERLFKEYFSQSVSQSELKSYFEEHKEQFKLKEDIIKGLYLKIPIESPQLGNFRKWYTQSNDDAVQNIEKHTLQNATGYEYFYDKWLKLSDFIDRMPYSAGNSEQFLRSNKYLEVQDESFVYFLNIKEYRLAGTDAPYEYALGYLTEIFKEKKRETLMKQVEEDLHEKATSDGNIKFYVE